jgi:hypothetical protein
MLLTYVDYLLCLQLHTLRSGIFFFSYSKAFRVTGLVNHLLTDLIFLSHIF